MSDSLSIMHDKYHLLEMLIETTRTAYAILNEDGNIIEVNKHLLDILKCNDLDLLIGKSLKMFICKNELEKYDNTIKELLEGKHINNLEFCINNSSLLKTDIIWIQINAGLMENGTKKIFCIINNVTKNKSEDMKKYILEQKKRDKIKQSIARLRK